jgi:hypothetical protein
MVSTLISSSSLRILWLDRCNTNSPHSHHHNIIPRAISIEMLGLGRTTMQGIDRGKFSRSRNRKEKL